MDSKLDVRSGAIILDGRESVTADEDHPRFNFPFNRARALRELRTFQGEDLEEVRGSLRLGKDVDVVKFLSKPENEDKLRKMARNYFFMN